MKKYQVLKWVVLGIAIAINVFIIVNSFITGEMSAKESNRIAHTTADVINTVKPETITEKNFDKFAFNIRKLYGHFGLCAVSGGFSTWAIYLFTKDKKIGYFPFELAITFGFGLFISLFTEFIQVFVADRTGAWKDVGIDFLGYFCGVFLVFLIFLIRKSKIFFKSNYFQKQAE